MEWQPAQRASRRSVGLSDWSDRACAVVRQWAYSAGWHALQRRAPMKSCEPVVRELWVLRAQAPAPTAATLKPVIKSTRFTAGDIAPQAAIRNGGVVRWSAAPRFDIVARMVVGLTGGIACGKTTVAGLLRARGAVVVDADVVARDVVAPGTPGLARVLERFGADLVDAQGGLDRGALGARVFGDPLEREALEGILHPLIAVESMRQLAAALATRPPLVIYDAALLIEAGRADQFRPLIVVRADPAAQRARLISRDGLTPAQAQARIDAQMPVARKAALADHVIDNTGSQADTEAQVAALWAHLVPPQEPRSPHG